MSHTHCGQLRYSGFSAKELLDASRVHTVEKDSLFRSTSISYESTAQLNKNPASGAYCGDRVRTGRSAPCILYRHRPNRHTTASETQCFNGECNHRDFTHKAAIQRTPFRMKFSNRITGGGGLPVRPDTNPPPPPSGPPNPYYLAPA